MQRVLVTYADSNFEKAAERLIEEAKKTDFFQQYFSYNKSDLPESVLKSSLLRYKKGGGYWSWKPSLVLKTFEKLSMGDILVYMDAGCQLYKHKEWNKFSKILLTYDSIFFNLYSPINNYVKRETLDFFRNEDLFVDKWNNNNIFAGGVFILKKTELNIRLMQKWHSIMFTHPELVLDINPQERDKELPCFIEHRHDQSILTLLLYNYIDEYKIKLLWENFENRSPFGQAIFAARNKDSKEIKIKPINIISFIYWHNLRLPIIYFVKSVKNNLSSLLKSILREK
jgi:hypothetical protein